MHRPIRPLLAAALALGCGAASAGSKTTLNDTGIGWCVDTATGLAGIACAGTGQDGEFGRDVTDRAPGNGPLGFHYRKVCNSGKLAGETGCSTSAARGTRPVDWGCTQDVHTGLVWELRSADPASPIYEYTLYTNQGGGAATDTSGLVATINAQGLCGAGDWRLPTRTEIMGQQDLGLPGGFEDGDWFPDSGGGLDLWTFWTSQPVVGWAGYSWALDERIDQMFLLDGDYAFAYARLVREPSPRVVTPRFVATDHLVTDRRTRLVWRRCSEGMTWDGSRCHGQPTPYTWDDALAHARGVAAGTGAAWRVPNIKELESLVDASVAYPAIDAAAFPGATNDLTWSSSASPFPIGYPMSQSYAVAFGNGAIYTYGWLEPHAVRLVRDKTPADR